MTGNDELPSLRALGSTTPVSIELERVAAPGAIAELRHAGCDFARAHGAESKTVDDVALAVSEAVTNAVKYGYEPGTVGSVRLAAVAADRWLEIRVSDLGDGFQEGRSDGLGLGLSLIAEASAELEISQTSAGTALRMRFPLPSEG
jgi:anti-sigma regulatory factor (Ser/Thr protein kinase)